MKNIDILALFIFNTELKPNKENASDEEKQEAKILYYYPSNEKLVTKRFITEIIEGTIGLFNNFSKKSKIKTNDFDLTETNLETSNLIMAELTENVVISKEKEPNLYISFKIKISNDTDNMNMNFNIMKNNFEKIIDNFYNTFVLFNGRIKNYSQFSLMDDFFLNFLKSLNNENTSSFFLDSLHFFPLRDMIYSQFLLACRRLKEKIPDIKYASVFYKGYLIHNEIPFDVLTILYNHFYCNLNNECKYKDFSYPITEKVTTIYTEQSNDKMISQNFFKGFQQQDKNINTFHLIGLSSLNINNYSMFIPKLYFASSNEEVQMIVFVREEMLIFLFFNSKFNSKMNITKLLLIDKNIRKYFEEELVLMRNLIYQKNSILEEVSYIYNNTSNNCVKFSNSLYDKSRKFKYPKFYELLDIINIGDKNPFFISKTNGGYLFYFHCYNRECSIMIKGKDLKECKTLFLEFKKKTFDQLFLI